MFWFNSSSFILTKWDGIWKLCKKEKRNVDSTYTHFTCKLCKAGGYFPNQRLSFSILSRNTFNCIWFVKFSSLINSIVLFFSFISILKCSICFCNLLTNFSNLPIRTSLSLIINSSFSFFKVIEFKFVIKSSFSFRSWWFSLMITTVAASLSLMLSFSLSCWTLFDFDLVLGGTFSFSIPKIVDGDGDLELMEFRPPPLCYFGNDDDDVAVLSEVAFPLIV